MQNTHTRIALILALVCLPLTAVAQSAIEVADSIAGLGATVHMSGLTPGDATLSIATPDDHLSMNAKADASGNAVAILTPAQTQSAGTYVVSVSQSGKAVGSSQFDVSPDTVDVVTSDVRTAVASIAADGSEQATVTVTLRDQYGNALSDRPVTLVSSRLSDIIVSNVQATNAKGQQTFLVSAVQNGTLTLRALDLLSGKPLQSSTTITAGTPSAIGGTVTTTRASVLTAQATSFDIIDRFEVTTSRTMVVGQEAPKVSIRAIDKKGNTVENYTGTVRFDAPDDPDATLPALGRYTFKDGDLGEKTFPITLKFSLSGEQTLRVEDEQDPTIYGEVKITVTGGDGHSAAQHITITSPKEGETINTPTVTLVGTGPKLANLVVTGGKQQATGDTDGTGKFSIEVPLDISATGATLNIKDDAGRYDSGPLHLVVDATPPAIKNVTINPAQPISGEQVLVVVESEPKLPSVTVKLPSGTASTLSEMNGQPGTYQGFLMSPVEPGSYQPIISATDRAGNTAEVRAMLNVGKPGLPKVTGLQAEGKINSVSLQWDSTPGGVDGYRVYVGETATNFLYNLDTGRDVNKATVAGLSPGKTYFFAVTALQTGDESADKSDIAQVTVLGLTLTVQPQDASLVVSWPGISTQLPLSSFILEYGVTDGKYTEKRVLNGDLKTYTIRDLLNGVHYFLKLTPVTTTGDQLTDLAATGDGTPSGTGFHAGPGDPIPFNAAHPTVKPTLLNQTGVPSFIWWLTASAALAAAAGVWYRRRSLRHNTAFLHSIQARYH